MNDRREIHKHNSPIINIMRKHHFRPKTGEHTRHTDTRCAHAQPKKNRLRCIALIFVVLLAKWLMNPNENVHRGNVKLLHHNERRRFFFLFLVNFPSVPLSDICVCVYVSLFHGFLWIEWYIETDTLAYRKTWCTRTWKTKYHHLQPNTICYFVCPYIF